MHEDEKSGWSLEIHHIDVGGGKPALGDATLIVVMHKGKIKRTCLIDGGSIATRKGSPVLRYLEETIPEGMVLDVLISTHYDDQHLDGLVGLLNATGKDPQAFNTAGTKAKPGHRLFRKTRVIDMGFNSKYVKLASSSKYADYLKSIYGLRVGSLDQKRNALTSEDSEGGTVAKGVKPYVLVHYVGETEIMIENENGERTKKDQVEAEKIFALRDISERVHVTRWVSDPPQAAPKPSWLLEQDELLWSKGDSKEGLTPATPAGAPTLVCVAGNRHYRDENGDIKKYNPQSTDLETYLDHSSLAFVLTFNKFKYYVGGDLRSGIENEVCKFLNPNDNFAGSVQVIKTSHHGEDTSTSKAFLQRLRPIVAVISCGLKNPKSQPHTKTVDRLQKTEYTIENNNRMKLFTQAYYLTGFFNTETVTPPPPADKQFIPELGTDKPQSKFDKFTGLKVAGEMYRYDKDEQAWTAEKAGEGRAISKVAGLPGDVVVAVSYDESNRESQVAQNDSSHSLFRVTYQGFKPNREVVGNDDEIKLFERAAQYRPISEVFKQAKTV